MNLLNNMMGMQEQTLQLKARRLEVIAQNIANADTPNYKARDIDFKAVLGATQKQETSMDATQSGHYAAAQALSPDGMRFRTPFNTSFDGNTVEMSLEQAQYGKAAGDYQATLNFLQSRIGGIRKALKGE
ncbi:MAG: flagellar basal body rod protein FlgB [Limnohabitans sp.]|jgi:flagellar basal-body rod protein FlgB